MKFEEIFKERGLYVGTNFAVGVAFEIDENKNLKLVTYKNVTDLNPTEENVTVHAGLFQKEYRKIYNRRELFNS